MCDCLCVYRGHHVNYDDDNNNNNYYYYYYYPVNYDMDYYCFSYYNYFTPTFVCSRYLIR